MSKIQELAVLFLRLGVTAFGGPAAHIAMLEDEVVTRRQWLDRQHFLDLMGATNLIPGPNSTEMVMHVGRHRAGFAGLVVAGLCFILPAALITGIIAWFYQAYGELPQVEPFLMGIKPVVLAVILNALVKLGQKALKKWAYAFIGLAVVVATLLGLNEVVAILAGGIAGMLLIRGWEISRQANGILPFGPLLLTLPLLRIVTQPPDYTSLKLFLSFLKIGAVLFGSGYVLFAYLEGELVQRLGWLTEQQLLDAIAVGQFTPGPVLTTSTFIGYQIGGLSGAVLATLGIFLPSFFFVALLYPVVPLLRKSAWAAAFLDAVNISAVGLMLAVLIELTLSTVLHPMEAGDWQPLVIALLAGIVVFRFPKVSTAWLVLGGAVLGYGLSLL